MDTFSVEPTNGRVKLAKALDSVQRNHYRLLVKAEDDSDPPKYDTAEVRTELRAQLAPIARRAAKCCAPFFFLLLFVFAAACSRAVLASPRLALASVGSPHPSSFYYERRRRLRHPLSSRFLARVPSSQQPSNARSANRWLRLTGMRFIHISSVRSSNDN